MSDNIKVVVKVRPLISREIEDKLSFQWRVKNNTLYQLDANGKDSGVQYTFDKVYDVSTKTADVYEDVAKPIVEAAIAGFNGTIFAYGQTSSGKTYTMSGTETSPGIIELAVLNLFDRIKCIPDRDFLVRVSYIEIYNETLKDLLNVYNEKVKIREPPQGGVRVETTEKFTSSPEEVMEIMREGEANRQIGATNMNEESSRSHSIFQITIESREHTEGQETTGCVNVSQLNLVDLAGSERSGQTGATGKRFKEGTHINKSLSVLALVIKQLSEDPHKHANYRDSKLTRILQNSLGGNAKTSIICAVTPAAVEETISTLQFANRAKAIKNKPEVNAVATDATKLQDLTKQLSKLQSELAIKNNIEQDNRFLLKQIENLQKLVLNGFGDRSLEIGGARRKTWCAPRRMTISTSSLRSVEDCEPAVPRFCTPTLKYNPLSLPTAREFQPVGRPSALPSVCEDREMLTPPPKKVGVNDDIIDLDSDEDNTSNTSCSPYHKCYNATKTPPCVLRKNAKMAEQSLREIEELTTRERLYHPDVVEYMEKLEQTKNKVANLEDEIKSLSAVNIEKNLEVEQLKENITQTKSQIETISSAKTQLEAQCNEYSTKLTDLEVSYETLKTKAKLREEELLSLINEQTNNKKLKESISGKSLSRTFDKDFGNFMDMSKDISLVSDDDSIDSSNNEPSGQQQRLVDDVRAGVAARHDTIVKLETDLLQQKLAIETLESTCTDLRKQIVETNNKLNYTEEENSLLKSSLETLKSTIDSQKQNLESANNDIESYNAVIKELQVKLVDKKYHKIDLNISDDSLEKMIDNEEKIIANNENLRNIIYSFKVALKTRNKKIEELESNQKVETPSPERELLSIQLEEKEKEILRLVEEAHKSKEHIQENINVINKLMEANSKLVKGADDLSDKLLNAVKQSDELEKRVHQLESENNEYKQQLHEFNENHDRLLKNLSDFKSNISDLQKEKEELSALQHEVHSKDNIIAELKSEITSKESQISSLSGGQIESQEYLGKWASAVSSFLVGHTGDAGVQTEFTDGSSNFETLCGQLNTVEHSVKEIVSQKELALVNNSKLQEEIEALQSQVKCLIRDKNAIEIDRDNQNQQVIQLNEKLEELQDNLIDLNKQIADVNAVSQLSQDLLKSEIAEKDEKINMIKNEDIELRVQLDKALQLDVVSRNEIEKLQSLLEANRAEFDEILQLKTVDASEKDILLDQTCIELQKISKTLDETICNRDQLLNNIYKAAIGLLSKLENHSNEYQLSKNNVYSNIMNILDRVSNGIVLLISCKSINEINNSEEMNQRLEIFKEENQQLIHKISYLENENSVLIVELEQIKIDNKKMINDLLKSDEVLKQLEVELHEKLFIIENLESKINVWKNNFTALEDSMKQQILELQISNSDLESQSQISVKKTLSNQTNETYILGPERENVERDRRQTIRNTLDDLLVEPRNYSPQSLLTLCCNKIIDAIQINELYSVDSSCNTCYQTTSTETQTDTCDCDRLLTENLELNAKVDFLQSINIQLLNEQEDIRKELKILVEPAQELQKKISNHKTSLSTLTATTYAENKLLKSQVKVLQHHHNRIYSVCQRDLPAFKKSLQELSLILKNTPSMDKVQAHIKRFSLPEVLDRSSSAFKDESTLDGDLLMLDTNVTLASVDNTLLVQDQTCLDGTQVYLDADINTDVIETIDPNILHTQIQMLSVENEKLTEKLSALKEENLTLHEKIDKLSDKINPEIMTTDAQRSPLKFNKSLNELNDDPSDSIESNHTTNKLCKYCNNDNNPSNFEEMTKELSKLSEELMEVKRIKSDLEIKYNSHNEEMIANDQLVIKISTLEKNNSKQLSMIDQLTNKLSSEHAELVRLQEENDLLSTQVMENIHESDSLRNEIDALKEINCTLSEKCADLEELTSSATRACIRCAHNTSTPESPITTKSVLNRSRSDSESSSRCNKLSTLQNELLAGREDCKTISEDVATIKNHLDRGELSMSHGMDLDDSMGQSNVFPFPKDLNTVSPKPNKLKLVYETPEEKPTDMYTLDKTDCFNYYVEKTEAENNFGEEIRIIDVMKMFYKNITAKHGNEVDNLVNKLKDFEESRNQLQQQIDTITSEYSKICDLVKEKDNRIKCITKTLNQLSNNIKHMNEEICGCGAQQNTVLVTMFKNNILNILDSDFDLSSVNIFENLIDKIVSKHQCDLLEIMNQYSELQGHMETLSSELKNVTENLNQMKCQLSEKEKEYNLLKAQKEKAHEISSAVTLDIVQREEELARMLNSRCQTLIDHNILSPNDIDSDKPVIKNMSVLIEKIINQSKQADVVWQEKHNLSLEVTKSKTALEEKDQELESLKAEVDKLRELCKNATNELLIKNQAIETQKALHDQLDEIYQKKVEENDTNAKIVENLIQELDILKAALAEKDNILQTLQQKNKQRNSDDSDTKAKISELIESIKTLEHENKNLKSVNNMITSESEQNAAQLAKADETIQKNKLELDKLTAEILTLNQSVKDSRSVIQSLKLEAKSLVEQNVAIKKQFEEANELCSQLKLNMKTHEKTAEIQCKIISRLKQEMEEGCSTCGEKEEAIKELADAKEALEKRVSELEMQLEGHRPRSSVGDARRRRQSLLDSKRAFSDDKLDADHKNMEAFFSTQEKPEDMFMDVDDHSNRSTPAINRRSDSFQSRNEESEEPGRPSSALERRRRRQSIHDQHRNTQTNIQDHLNTLNDINKTNGGDYDSEVATLRERLNLCQQELEELRERYREVDEECETCAEYLRERDEQCMQLKIENNSLQQQIAELNDKLKNASTVSRQIDTQRSFQNASVNTDEDWANLHSVVVDRMSFDREVEKNKTLQRTVDELRFKNGELKAAVAKMQKTAERAARNKANLQELEATKLELESCKRELEEYRERCRELDEECETCGEYLRERDQQITSLKQARDALEAKLEALQEKETSDRVQSVRNKRRSVHDLNRNCVPEARDVVTDTGEGGTDFI